MIEEQSCASPASTNSFIVSDDESAGELFLTSESFKLKVSASLGSESWTKKGSLLYVIRCSQ